MSKPFVEKLKPYLTPYYITVVAVLGLATACFVALVAVIVLVATNFNVLGLIE
jgi:hypothetical protein